MYAHDDAPFEALHALEPAAAERLAAGRRSWQATDLVIDGWLVQPMLNLLTRDGMSVRLRAQLMDLLVCLASRPGRVFRKDELLAEVWEGRWIADSGLSRCIAELRAAIGDDAQHPRVIQTIIKRGYRLVAPVEVPARLGPPTPPPWHAPCPAGRADARAAVAG